MFITSMSSETQFVFADFNHLYFFYRSFNDVLPRLLCQMSGCLKIADKFLQKLKYSDDSAWPLELPICAFLHLESTIIQQAQVFVFGKANLPAQNIQLFSLTSLQTVLPYMDSIERLMECFYMYLNLYVSLQQLGASDIMLKMKMTPCFKRNSITKD